MKYCTFIFSVLAVVAPLSCYAVYNPRGDRDHDGIPNYRDANQKIGPNGDRDTDGIPNKRDKQNNNRDYGDKDHDGIANIRDDHDNRLDPPKNR